MIVDGFEHQPGKHCGSTAMAALLRHAGLELSEAMVLGLGSGLHFFYVSSDELSPSRIIMGRSMTLEQDCASALGVQMTEHRTEQDDAAWEALRAELDAGRIAMVACDLSELPYWGSSTPWNGHRILVVGYDDDHVVVADTHFEGVQRISHDDLRRARASMAPPMPDPEKPFWTIESTDGHRPLAEAVAIAVERNAMTMEDADDGVMGLSGLRRFADDVANWEAQPDAAWCHRFAYQCIEKRGTGGGNFRQLYREFLSEARAEAPHVVNIQHGVAAAKLSQAWSTLATYHEAMSCLLDPERDDPSEDPRHHVASMAEAVYQFKESFWDQLSGF
jgi:hypothetical protein